MPVKRNSKPSIQPSLGTLRQALSAAERESPSRPRRMDLHERRAMQLIARMQAAYRRTQPFLDMPEKAGGHA